MENDQLAGLAGVAAVADATAVQPGAPGLDLPAGPPVIDYGQEAEKTIAMLSALIVGYAPATAAIWDEGAKARVSASLSPVLEKYGVTLDAIPCELVLIITAGPVLYQSAKIVAAQMKQAQAQAAAKPAAPASPLATPEAGVHAQVALYEKGAS